MKRVLLFILLSGFLAHSGFIFSQTKFIRYSNIKKNEISIKEGNISLEKFNQYKESFKQKISENYKTSFSIIRLDSNRYALMLEINALNDAGIIAKRSGCNILLPPGLNYGIPEVYFTKNDDFTIDAVKMPIKYEDYMYTLLKKISSFMTGGIVDWDKFKDFLSKLGVGKLENINFSDLAGLENAQIISIYWPTYIDNKGFLSPEAKKIKIIIPINENKEDVLQKFEGSKIGLGIGLTLHPIKNKQTIRTFIVLVLGLDDNNNSGKINYPNSKTTVQKGNLLDIHWVFNTTKSLKAELVKGNYNHYLGLIPNTGRCNFLSIPNNLSIGYYQIKLIDISNSNNYVLSDKFYISNKEDDYNIYNNNNNYTKRTSFAGRNINYQRTITVSSPHITIYAYDHGQEDGDIISLYLNGKAVLQNYSLTHYKKKINLNLESNGTNDLLLYAHNLGAIPPNTVALIIEGSGVQKQIVLNSNMSSCEGILIKVK